MTPLEAFESIIRENGLEEEYKEAYSTQLRVTNCQIARYNPDRFFAIVYDNAASFRSERKEQIRKQPALLRAWKRIMHDEILLPNRAIEVLVLFRDSFLCGREMKEILKNLQKRVLNLGDETTCYYLYQDEGVQKREKEQFSRELRIFFESIEIRQKFEEE